MSELNDHFLFFCQASDGLFLVVKPDDNEQALDFGCTCRRLQSPGILVGQFTIYAGQVCQIQQSSGLFDIYFNMLAIFIVSHVDDLAGHAGP